MDTSTAESIRSNDSSFIGSLKISLINLNEIIDNYRESLYFEAVKIKNAYSEERLSIHEQCSRNGDPHPRLDIYLSYSRSNGPKGRYQFEIQWRCYKGKRGKKRIYSEYIKKGKDAAYSTKRLLSAAQTCEAELTVRYEQQFAEIRRRAAHVTRVKQKITDSDLLVNNFPVLGELDEAS